MKQIERVLKLAAKGYRLFPLSPGSKIPLKGTNGVSDATADPVKIQQWYDERPSTKELNWGIAGGRIVDNESDYLIVIDVDTKEGKNGQTELESIIDKYGPVPDTLTVRTQSGGLHYYFKTRIKRNRYRARFKGCQHIDIKSSGGYLVLWGCQTPAGQYTVQSGHIDRLCYLEDWLKDDTEECINGTNKDYERQGTIDSHDGRWAYITSWAGKLRSDGLKGYALYEALLEKRNNMEQKPGDRIDELWIKNLADSFSTYKDNFAPTDQGNADRFIAAYGMEVKHAHQLGWFTWTGKQWERDIGEKTIIHYAGELINVVSQEISYADDDKHKKVLAKVRTMLSMNNSRRNALSLAKANPAITVDADDFDKAPYTLNVENGIIDLTTGDLKQHDPNLLMSKIAPIDYKPGEDCPKFKTFIEEITCGDIELAQWLQTYFGYSLTASVKEQLFGVFYGTGGNGKSVLVNVVTTIMGQYTLETPVETVMQNRFGKTGANNDVARIKGSRLVTVRESDQGHSLAESLIKSLTGGDKITARFLHKEFFEFKPVAKWILFTNHKPSIKGTDEGIWRRVKLVPFKYRVPEDKKNKDLESELLNEAPGILNWLVEGCLMWQKNGFPKCTAIDSATNAYQQDEDRVGEFLNDAVNTDDGLKVSASDLYKAYRWFCKDAGDIPLSSRNFPKKMEEKGYEKKRIAAGNYWFRIDLTDEYKAKINGFDEAKVGF